MTEIRNRFTGEVICKIESGSLKELAQDNKANLRDANLRDTNLRCANLRYANLWGADLRCADLRYANLRYANLWGADLRGANLRGANLQGAKRRKRKQFTHPISIVGLQYIVMIWDSHIEIGCETLTFNQSKKMTTKKAEKLDGQDAVDFFNGPWELILRAIELKEKQVAEVDHD